MALSRTLLLTGFCSLLLAACGGATNTGGNSSPNTEGDGGTEPPGTGGASSSTGGASTGTGSKPGTAGATQGSGGLTGTAGSGAGAAGPGGSAGCCLAMATCAPGEKEIDANAECPQGTDCYTNSICCSTVRCARPLATCAAVPTCNPGDRELTGECPPSYACYGVSMCGAAITCLVLLPDGGPAPIGSDAGAGQACNAATDYNRSYVSTSTQECMLIDYMCPENTYGFSNSCGCGCEQDSGCPEWVDCMPGPGTPNPLCTDEGHVKCPFTKKAL